jgi:hypothetical protein
MVMQISLYIATKKGVHWNERYKAQHLYNALFKVF